MRITGEQAGKLRSGLHKLNDEELIILGELVGSSVCFFYVNSKDDFITEVIECIGRRVG